MNNKKPMKGHGFIYMYTSPSGKHYIGQTIQSLIARSGSDGKYYKGSKKFYEAILKYGFKNFKIDILEECLIEELNEKEKYYIKKYNSLFPNGYNISEGGDAIFKDSRPIYQYDFDTKQLISQYSSTKEASAIIGVHQTTINACVVGYIKSCKDTFFSYDGSLTPEQIPERPPANKNKQIYMFNEDCSLSQIFNSIGSAASYVNGERCAIKKCCRGEIDFAYGHKWICEEASVKQKKYNNTAKPIAQLDKDTLKIIKTYPSCSAAMKEFKKSGTTMFRRALANPKLNAYGYKWKYI